jgi:hypothetical protein
MSDSRLASVVLSGGAELRIEDRGRGRYAVRIATGRRVDDVCVVALEDLARIAATASRAHDRARQPDLGPLFGETEGPSA